VVLIPSYNPGPKASATVRAALEQWAPVWVIVDGSTDGSDEALLAIAATEPALEVFVLPRNQGKGAAVLHGLRAAKARGFTHALSMDSDGQHPAERIPLFMRASLDQPTAMVLGCPVFDASAPGLRVKGRKISNWWANLETLWAGIADSLYGFRVYPIEPLIEVMRRQRWMRRFDFDVEAVVRLCWRGVPPVNLPAPVRYFSAAEGGVSHFHYGRDNALLTWMHFRLFWGFIARLPMLIARAIRSYIMKPMSDKASLMHQPAPLADVGLQREIANLFVQALNLEIKPEDIDPEAPLYGEGLGLDSIDILEVALIVSKQYGVQLRADASDNQQIFRSLRHLAEYIATHRSK
jgi:glycosyltransferase involved in cell wall biosynthesis/acyl carrier protein